MEKKSNNNKQHNDLVKYRIKKAKSMIKQSKFLLDNKMYDGSINRSYYALFSSIRAILAIGKIDRSSHSGIHSVFDKYFVKSNIVDKKYSKILHLAFDSRQDSDYKDFYNSTKKEAFVQYKNIKAFIKMAENLIRKIQNEKINFPRIET